MASFFGLPRQSAVLAKDLIYSYCARMPIKIGEIKVFTLLIFLIPQMKELKPATKTSFVLDAKRFSQLSYTASGPFECFPKLFIQQKRAQMVCVEYFLPIFLA